MHVPQFANEIEIIDVLFDTWIRLVMELIANISIRIRFSYLFHTEEGFNQGPSAKECCSKARFSDKHTETLCSNAIKSGLICKVILYAVDAVATRRRILASESAQYTDGPCLQCVFQAEQQQQQKHPEDWICQPRYEQLQ
jgi:hypothetical protein